MSIRPGNGAGARTHDATTRALLSQDNQCVLEANMHGVGVNASSTVPGGGVSDAQLAFDQLNPVEQSAASLGVHPDAWKPISFMNEAHYKTLVSSNALDATLARRIEAFRRLAEADARPAIQSNC